MDHFNFKAENKKNDLKIYPPLPNGFTWELKEYCDHEPVLRVPIAINWHSRSFPKSKNSRSKPDGKEIVASSNWETMALCIKNTNVVLAHPGNCKSDHMCGEEIDDITMCDCNR